MRPLTTTRAIGLLAAGAMVIAACGGTGATTAPTQAAATATAAPVATDAPATAAPGFSFVLPSFRGDPELEAMIPDTIGGETVTLISMTGDEIPIGGSPEIAAALEALDKTTADLSVAFAGTTALSIVAFRVKGVQAGALFDAFKAAQTDQYTTENASFGGKSVVKTTSAGTVAFMYLKDDTMFVVGGSGTTAPTDDLLNEAFSKLP